MSIYKLVANSIQPGEVVTSVGGLTGDISNAQLAAFLNQTGTLTTANVIEVSNLYYTVTRANSAIDDRVTKAFVENLNIDVPNNKITGNIVGSQIEPTGVSPATYGGASKVPVIAIDHQGRITSASNVNVAGVSTFTSSGNSFTISTADGGTFTANIQPDSIRLGSDTTGIYVANLVQGSGISLTGLAAEGATPTIGLATSGVVANTYGGASKVPVIEVDQFGRIVSAANVNVAGVTNFSATGNSFTISTADGGSFTANIQPDSVILGTDTTGAYVANLVAGTGVILSGLGNEGTTPSISIGQAVGTNNNVTFANVTVTGNLTVQGNAVIFESNTLVITDPLIQVGKNPVGDAVDLGFFGHYIGGSPSTERHAGLFRDATDGQFKLFTNLDPEPATIVDTANATYQSANLVVNFVVGKVTDISNHSTTGLAEGTNLYFTNARSYANVTQIGYATNSNVALKANIADLRTANVAELTNLYFTNARVYANVAQLGFTKTTISSTAPTSPNNGDKWVDLGNLIEFTYINDGDSSQWVQLPASYLDTANLVTSVAGVTGAVSNTQLAAAITSTTLTGITVSGTSTLGTISGTSLTTTTATGRVSHGTDAGGSISIGNISSLGASTPYIDFNSGATTVDYDARIQSSGGNGTLGNGNLSFTAASTSITGNLNVDAGSLYVDHINNRIGIGTTTPTDTLHLRSTGPVRLIMEADTDNINEADNPQIYFIQDGGAVSGRIGFSNSNNSIEIWNNFADSVYIGTSNLQRFTVTANGLIGISTSTPSANLHVVGNVLVSANVNATRFIGDGTQLTGVATTGKAIAMAIVFGG